MIDGLLELAKHNPFVNPFQTVKCSGNDQVALPRSTVIPSRNIAFAAAAPTGKSDFIER